MPSRKMTNYFKLLRTVTFLFIASSLLLSISGNSLTTKYKPPIYSEIEGRINDMWIDDLGSYCVFNITIIEGTEEHNNWSGGITIAPSMTGGTITTRVVFYNETSGEYENPLSSEGWKTGDQFSGKLAHFPGSTLYDSIETFYLYIQKKSEINYADTLTFGIKTSQLILIGIVCFSTIGIVIYYKRCVRKIKG